MRIYWAIFKNSHETLKANPMDLRHSYFAIPSLLVFIDRCLNPRKRSNTIQLHNNEIKVSWTNRAENALKSRDKPLIAEMQLYFSCMVKKRVLFHDETELETVAVNDELKIIFRPVQSTSCSPDEFAQNHPVKQEFKTMGAVKMKPKSLEIDFKKGQWVGEYQV